MRVNRLRFRDATRSDTAKIVPLLNQTFRTPIDAATWEWYVFGNPLGHSRVYLAVEPDDRFAGIIAFAPISLRVAGSPVIGDFAHHLVLEPAYRDTLSFIALNRHALQAQAALGRGLAIGPPNRTAYPIHKTIMKWADFGFLECVRKLRPVRRPHGCTETVLFEDEFNDFYSSVSRELAFCVDKTADWMNWRFCQRPGKPYTVYTIPRGNHMAGYVVLKRWQDHDGYRKAHVLDLHAIDDEALAHLAAAADTYAEGCDEVNLWAIQGYRYREALEALGFEVNPAARQPFIARSYDGSRVRFPEGDCSFGYGDGDTLY
jgi:hypothetical protein